MSEFEREDRYAVIKYKKLTNQQWTLVPSLLEKFDSASVDCVVIEKDWPEYNFVWLMLEHRMAGFPVPDFNAVKCAADVAIAQAELETAQATIARLTAENERLKRDHQHMVDRNALLRQRPDLPVDRLPAHKRLGELQASQPAPVSLVLDAHEVAGNVRTTLDRKACPNAWAVIAYEATVEAIDKVKELNQ